MGHQVAGRQVKLPPLFVSIYANVLEHNALNEMKET